MKLIVNILATIGMIFALIIAAIFFWHLLTPVENHWLNVHQIVGCGTVTLLTAIVVGASKAQTDIDEIRSCGRERT